MDRRLTALGVAAVVSGILVTGVNLKQQRFDRNNLDTEHFEVALSNAFSQSAPT